jgi:hypothetical protein
MSWHLTCCVLDFASLLGLSELLEGLGDQVLTFGHLRHGAGGNNLAVIVEDNRNMRQPRRGS